MFFALLTSLISWAQNDIPSRMERYAGRYAQAAKASDRIPLANDFFAYLLQIDYIDEPVAFPASAHIDSVDVNVWYYLAEWYYGEGEYSKAVDYCLLAAERCTDKVDENSKGDVYSLLGAAYFRLGEFDKAADALNVCYEIDSRGGNPDQLSSTLNNIASVLIAAGKPQEAEKYILEAIAANSLTDNLVRRAVLFGTASEMYKAMDQGEQSLVYARRALDIERQRGDSAKTGVRLSQVANAELGMARIKDAKRSLEEAMPLLEASGNRHSLGICLNQMGDILSAEGEDDEAAGYYRRAAELFFAQRDMYNERHAREGLYKVLKTSAPDEAMLHLERATRLRDSIYQKETAEAISRYNAIYHNDLLQQESERAQRQKQAFLITAAVLAVITAVLCIGAWITYRRSRRKAEDYEQGIHSLQHRYEEISRQYRNLAIESLPNRTNLTEDDKAFLAELTAVIDEEMEKGNADVESIARRMHISPRTLQRRMNQTLSLSPQAYLTQVRMQKARFLLLNYRDITVNEVAEKCGYTLMTNFTRAFVRFYGFKPSELRLQKLNSDFTPPPRAKSGITGENKPSQTQ